MYMYMYALYMYMYIMSHDMSCDPSLVRENRITCISHLVRYIFLHAVTFSTLMSLEDETKSENFLKHGLPKHTVWSV